MSEKEMRNDVKKLYSYVNMFLNFCWTNRILTNIEYIFHVKVMAFNNLYRVAKYY